MHSMRTPVTSGFHVDINSYLMKYIVMSYYRPSDEFYSRILLLNTPDKSGIVTYLLFIAFMYCSGMNYHCTQIYKFVTSSIIIINSCFKLCPVIMEFPLHPTSGQEANNKRS